MKPTSSTPDLDAHQAELEDLDSQISEILAGYMETSKQLQTAIKQEDFAGIDMKSKFLLRLFYTLLTLITDREIIHLHLWEELKGLTQNTSVDVRDLKEQLE